MTIVLGSMLALLAICIMVAALIGLPFLCNKLQQEPHMARIIAVHATTSLSPPSSQHPTPPAVRKALPVTQYASKAPAAAQQMVVLAPAAAAVGKSAVTPAPAATAAVVATAGTAGAPHATKATAATAAGTAAGAGALRATAAAEASAEAGVAEREACPICFVEYAASDWVKTLPCHHFYHKQCIDSWLKRDDTCPLCKMTVTSKSTSDS